MKITTESNIIEFNRRPLEKDEIKSLHIPNRLEHEITRNIIEVNGKYYYSKSVSNNEMINELIASKLARLIDLDAVDYQIGSYGGCLYALSELFYDDEHTYHHCDEYFHETVEQQKQYQQSFKLFSLYLNQPNILKLTSQQPIGKSILKLTALDLKMGQMDRHNENVQIRKRKDGKSIELSPIYDSANAYTETPIPTINTHFYDNPFLVVRKNKLSLAMLVHKNPEIAKSIETLRDIPIEDVLNQIENDKHIKIVDAKKSYYQEKDQQYTKILKNL